MLQGLSEHVATPAPPNTVTADENSSTGVSIDVLVTFTLAADVTEIEAPCGARLKRNTLSLMRMRTDPLAEMAPPWPLLTRNGVLDHKGVPHGQQQSTPEHPVFSEPSALGSQPPAWLQPGLYSRRLSVIGGN